MPTQSAAMFQRFLDSRGYEVYAADSGERALEMLGHIQFDAVIPFPRLQLSPATVGLHPPLTGNAFAISVVI